MLVYRIQKIERTVNHGDVWENKDMWREGTYLDLWSVVHMLGGLIAGFITAFFSAPFLLALFIFVLLAILWEMFEVMKLIWETSRNRVTDVALGALVFPVGFYIFTDIFVEAKTQMTLLSVIVLIFGILNYLGWRASDNGGK